MALPPENETSSSINTLEVQETRGTSHDLAHACVTRSSDRNMLHPDLPFLTTSKTRTLQLNKNQHERCRSRLIGHIHSHTEKNQVIIRDHHSLTRSSGSRKKVSHQNIRLTQNGRYGVTPKHRQTEVAGYGELSVSLSAGAPSLLTVTERCRTDQTSATRWHGRLTSPPGMPADRSPRALRCHPTSA